jgi:DNA polymerase III epsilon subunit-like protein
MKFFLDFEATRFSNRIISIGCVAENGNTFYTLVKPVNKAKVDRFITELTGITNAMLAAAPSADEAFNQLFDFIEQNSCGIAPEFYCYGDSDATFINHTVKYMEDARACMCALAIGGNIIDYASVVKKFFLVKTDMALRKVYMLIKAKKELVQKHDALEDALMLQCVVENLEKKCKPEDKDTILAMPSQKKPNVKKAPAQFRQWDGSSKWDANTNANENSWMLKCIDQHSGDVKFFDSAETAALWVIRYIARNVSPKSAEHRARIGGAIMNATESKKCRYNCYWFYNPEGAIANAASANN